MAGIKKAKTNNLTFQLCSYRFPESAENCHGRDSWRFPGSGNFSQSPANFGGAVSPVEKRSGGVERSRYLILGVERLAEIFDRSDSAGMKHRFAIATRTRRGMSDLSHLKPSTATIF
jgi:hypothetical protein